MRIILTIDACPEKLQWRLPLNDHHEQIFYQCVPNLYLDGVGALTVEIPERETLSQLLENQLNLPSFAVYILFKTKVAKGLNSESSPIFVVPKGVIVNGNIKESKTRIAGSQ